MSFNQSTFGPIASHGNSDMPNMWTYRSSDTLSGIISENYFEKKLSLINDGDFISIHSLVDGFMGGHFNKSNGSLTISADPYALNTEVINQESDITTQTDDTITFKANTKYKFGALVTTNKEIIIENGAMIEGIGLFALVLVYTGTGKMFSSTGASWTMQSIRFSCPNGTVFDKQGVGTVLIKDTFCEECDHVGGFSSVGAVIPNGLQLAIVLFGNIKTSGLILSDTFTLFAIREVFLITTNSGVTLIDWAGTTFSNFEIANLECRGPLGSTCLSGDAGGVNISPGSVATIQDSTLGLPGTATPLGGGLTADDTAYSYANTRGVIDSKAIGFSFVVTPALTDVQDGVDIQIAGTFANGAESSQSSSDAGGAITMLNRIEKRGTVSANLDISKQTGSASEYLICVQKDDGGLGFPVRVEGICSSVTLAGGGSAQPAVKAPVRFIEGDKFWVTITGVGNDLDVTVTTEGFEITE